MCKRTIWAIALGAWCIVRGASAQDLAPLRARVDSLAIAWRDAQLFATLRDSLRRHAPPPNMERVQAGALTVMADPSHVPLEAATRAAWALLDGFYGDGAAKLAGRPVVLRVLTPQQTRRPGAGERWVLATTDLDSADLTQLLVRNAPLPRTDAALQEWLAAPLVPPGNARRERAAVYVDLVTAQASVAQGCFGGDLTACRVALGLTNTARPVLDWWTANDRRLLVPALLADYYLGDAERRTLASACLQAGADSACVQLLESIPTPALPRPLGSLARLSLTQLALERGGRGAYGRLLADSSAGVLDRLSAASGLPPDSLVMVWRSAVLSARPTRVTLPWWTVAVVLGWIGGFATCALQSTRWRV